MGERRISEDMENRKNKGEWIGLLTGICGTSIFGFSFMFSRISMTVTSPENLLMWRFLFAVLFMTILIVILKFTRHAEGWLGFDLKGKSLKPLLWLGFIQPVFYFTCESNGINLTNATMSGVMLALVPIIAIVIGVFYLHEKTNGAQVAFSVLSILGVIVMTLCERADGGIHMLGMVFLCGAVSAGAYFNAFSRKIAEEYTPLERTYVMMVEGAVVFTAAALIRGKADPAALRYHEFQISILYLSLLSSIVAFLGINMATSRLSVAKVSALSNITTVLSMFAGVIFLGEPFTLLSFTASVIILIGVIGVQKT